MPSLTTVARDAVLRMRRPPDPGELGIQRWIAFSLMIGVVAGLGAALLQWAIDSVNALALVRLAGYGPPGLPSEGGDLTQRYLPGFRWWLFPLVPALGGLVTGFIVYRFAPEAEGHGTDAVIRAYHREGGVIRARVPIVKIVASAITLGTGGSGGREGPIAQIGSGFGAWFASALRLTDRERRIMLLAGAAGGIGAIFRAPLGGALVICELLYRNMEFEYDAVVPALLTAVVGYTVYSLIFGWAPMFETSHQVFDHPENLLVYLVLGIVVALLGWCYVKTFYAMHERLFARLPLPRMVRPALGGLLTGLLGLAVPQAVGLGYGWIQLGMQDRLGFVDYAAGALGKIVATGFTISSGGSGGVFGPAVVIGGFAGGAVGRLFAHLLPSWHLHPEAFILVGMAAFFGGAAKAPIGALLMISEMTSGYGLLVPLMLACAVAFMLVPRHVSIYAEQVDGSVSSPAHFERYLTHVVASLRRSAAPGAPGERVPTGCRVAAPRPSGAPLADAGLLDVDVGRAAGRRVGDLSLGRDVAAVAIRRGGRTLVPASDALLAPGDRLVVIAPADRLGQVLDALRPPPSALRT
ncbi:MAG TPA: chloride channel protein [Methylomirabilota bacterium]|nr:chloride channel protein [Methylomirabilota bacterium]